MTANTSRGGYRTTQVKLDILRRYLSGFNLASKRAGSTVYLELFAGSVSHIRPDTLERYDGSAAIALRTNPGFTRLVFWEPDGPMKRLRADLSSAFPGDRRYHVIAGDCNESLAVGLSRAQDLQWAPTLAFLGPMGLQVAWETISSLSKWRRDRRGQKVEQLMLFPEPALARVLGSTGVRGSSSASRLTRLFGNDDWIAIHQHRRAERISPAEMRAEFVNLLRWQLEHELGYLASHALQLGNVGEKPAYTLVFATDSDSGDSIMRDVYSHPMVNEIPAMRSSALAARRGRRDELRGTPRLFPMDDPTVKAYAYAHREPWEPLQPIGDSVELDDEPSGEDGGDADDPPA